MELNIKKHLVIAAHDGVFSYYTGVGTIVQNTIKVLLGENKFPSIKISIAGIGLNPDKSAFDRTAYEDSKALVNKYGGHLISLANDTPGVTENDTWKDPINWQVACNSLVSVLNTILDETTENYIMLHDTVFLYFEVAKRQLRPELEQTLRSYYLPHSSGKCHYYTEESWNRKRIEYENQCFSLIMKNPSSRLIATGHNFSRHLVENYGVSFTEHDYLVNGLLFDNYIVPANLRCTFEDIQRIVPKLSRESKIIFSWGRLSQAKGFYELLLAWDAIANDFPEYSLIIQAPTSCLDESSYFEKFSKKAASVQRVYHIDNFSSEIWQKFLRYDKTCVVCLASTMDPNPHTPIEAKLFGKNMNYAILASFKDGIKDSFSMNECVSLDDPCDIEDFSNKLITAINLDPKRKREMSQKNFESAFSFSYKKNLLVFLQKEGIIL